MSHPWTAERTVGVDEARALVAAQFPQLVGLPVASFGAGWDNSAFLVGDCVFRFPRRAVAVPLIELESRVLPAIAPGLPLAIPVPRYLGLPGDSYPWPFLGYTMLPGRTATSARLDDAQRAACAEPLGRFLAALHAIPTAALDLPLDPFGKLDPARALPNVRARIAIITAQRSHPDPQRLLAAIEAATRDLRPAAADTLVHGDLYASHLLVDERGAAAGVIDWGDVHLGDRAVDLSLVAGFLPASAQERFFAAYGPVDETCWRMACFRALLHGTMELAYAHDIGDADAKQEALASFDRLGA